MLFTERLTPPPLWWVIGVLGAATFPVAVVFYLGPVWALATAVVAAAVLLWVLVVQSTVRIEVDADRLRVGRAQIEVGYLAAAVPLDEEQTRVRTGPRADARAYLVLRPYIKAAVEITLDDPDDPVPYWVVSTRRPRALSAAITEALSSRVTG